MKKIFKFMPLVVIALCSMMIVACGDDDDDNGGNNPVNPSEQTVASAGVIFNCSDNFADYFDVYLSVNGAAEQKITDFSKIYVANPPASLPATVKFTGRIEKKEGVDYTQSVSGLKFGAGIVKVTGIYNAASNGWSNLKYSSSVSSTAFSLPKDDLDSYIAKLAEKLNKEVTLEK